MNLIAFYTTDPTDRIIKIMEKCEQEVNEEITRQDKSRNMME